MTTADLVNLICDKLRTGRVEFIRIFHTNLNEMDIRYGGNVYAIYTHGKSVFVSRWNDSETSTTCDNYSKWIEGVLNGLIRDDEGNMVPQ